jgi:hypothetical protein
MRKNKDCGFMVEFGYYGSPEKTQKFCFKDNEHRKATIKFNSLCEGVK